MNPLTQPAMADPSEPPTEIVKVSGPQGLAASVPYMLGFHPTESIVVLCVQGPRRRMGPVIRMDIPRGAAAGRTTAEYLAGQAARHASGVAVICYTDEPNGRQRNRQVYPHSTLVHACLAELRNIGMPVFDAMLVRDNLVWSYLKHSASTEGYPLPAADDRSMGHLHSAQVGAGRAVLQNRAALAATLQGPVGIAAERAMNEVQRSATRFAGQIADLDYQQTTILGDEIAEQRLRSCWAAQLNHSPLPGAAVADLITVMDMPTVRDGVIKWGLQRTADEPLAMFIELARWAPDEAATQVCATLAVIAYRQGDGALAQLAVDRVLAAEPSHRLAGVLLELFNSGVRPEELDRLDIGSGEDPEIRARPALTLVTNEGTDLDDRA